jgi:hypothetical protein
MKLKRIIKKDGEGYFVNSITGERVEVNPNYTITNSKTSNMRFNTLLGLGQLVSVFGWIVVVVSVIFTFYGIDSIKTLGTIAIVSCALVG